MVKKAKKRHFLAQSRTADFLMFPRLVLAQSHKILRSPHRPPHSLGNSESGITRPCMPTVRSSSISNIPHPWKSCRNHFYRNRIRSWDRYDFFCFSPTVKIRVPDTGSLSYHISSSHFSPFAISYRFAYSMDSGTANFRPKNSEQKTQ